MNENLNLLRTVSIYAVILLHSSAFYLDNYHKIEYNTWIWAVIISAVTKICVPLFLMLSGALLVGKAQDLGNFYKKRLPKLIIPLSFWSVVYIIVYYLKGGGYLEILTKWNVGVEYHLWYIYMVVGIYLIIPVISPFLIKASNKEIGIVLFIWFLSLFYNHLTEDYLPRFDLRYFSGYIGYVIFGFYLRKEQANNSFRKPLMLLGYLMGLLGTVGLVLLSTKIKGSFVPLGLEFLTPNIALMAVSVFALIMNLKIGTNKLVTNIAQYSYGVYFVHILVLNYLDELYFKPYIETLFIFTVVKSIFCLFLSYVIIWMVSKVLILQRIVN